MAHVTLIFLLLHGLALLVFVTATHQVSIHTKSKQDINDDDNNTEPPKITSNEQSWGKQRGKTQFDWLRSQEYKDVDNLFANSKFLDMNSRLQNDEKYNVLLKKILSTHQHKNRGKRSKSRKGRHGKHKKKKKAHKIGSNRHHSKRIVESKNNNKSEFRRENTSGLKIKDAHYNSNGEHIHSSQYREDDQANGIDLQEMDKMIMEMILGQLTSNNRHNAKVGGKNTGRHNTKTNDHTSNNTDTTEYNDRETPKESTKQENNEGMLYFDDEVELDDNKSDTVSIVTRFESYMDLMPLKVGEFSADFAADDDVGAGVWLDIHPKQHEKLNRGQSKGKTAKRKRKRRSVSLQEEKKNNSAPADAKTDVTPSNVEKLTYLQKTLNELDDILTSKLSLEKHKNETKHNIHRPEMKRQSKNLSEGSSKTAYAVNGDMKLNEKNEQRFEVKFAQINNQTSVRTLNDNNTKTTNNNSTTTILETMSGNLTSPSPIPTEDEKNDQGYKENMKEQADGHVKQVTRKIKHKLNVPTQEFFLHDQETPKVPRLNEAKFLDILIKPDTFGDNDKQCEKVQNIIHALKEFWKLATKHNNKLLSSANLRSVVLTSAMTQISEVIDMDNLEHLKDQLMRCTHPHDRSILHMVTKLRSILMRQYEALGEEMKKKR